MKPDITIPPYPPEIIAAYIARRAAEPGVDRQITAAAVGRAFGCLKPWQVIGMVDAAVGRGVVR